MTRAECVHAESHARRGLTMVEMVISIMLVGVMLVAALETVGASKLGQRKLHDRLSGHQLAQDLMAEILQQEYADPTLLDYLKTEILTSGNKVTATLGPETGEDATGDRSLFDDVDDYHGWSASPPRERNGTEMSSLTGWRREVVVQHVKDDDPTNLKDKDEGAKLIIVTVTRGDLPVATLAALRTLGPPPTEACCLGDGTCIDLAPDVCTTLGSTPMGPGTSCYTTNCCTPQVIFEEFTEAKVNSDRVTLDTPPGTEEGDLLIAAVVVAIEEGPMRPSAGGWFFVDQFEHQGTDLIVGVWWKLADASESATHQFFLDDDGECYAWMIRFTGHDPDNPIDAAAMDDGRSSSPTCPAIVTTRDDCLILRLGGFDDDDITVDEPGLADHEPITMDESGSGDDTCSGGAGYIQQPTAGDTGTADFVLTAREQFVTFTIAIAPRSCQ